MSASTAVQIKGWKVYRGEQSERDKKLGQIKWKAISQLFVVRSAAQEFATLAKKQYPLVDVRAEYVR